MSKQNDTVDLIASYLAPIRQKEAAEKQAMTESYQDSASNNVEGNDKKSATDSQTNLGLEQSEDAKDAGSTVEDEKDNNDTMGEKPTDDQGTKTLDVDEKVTEKGNIGPIVQQEITQQQKTASEHTRVTNLANAVISTLAANQKQASQAPTAAPAQEPSELEKIASQLGNEYAESFLAGVQARQRDEAELQKNAALKEHIEAAGGVGVLLDKIAMEQPESVLPPEALAPEAAPVAEEGAAPSDAELEEVSQILAEAGATPEDLQEAVALMEELKASGATDEDLAQALSEIGGEMAPAEEAPVGGEVEKTAAEQKRANVDNIKAILSQKLS